MPRRPPLVPVELTRVLLSIISGEPGVAETASQNDVDKTGQLRTALEHVALDVRVRTEIAEFRLGPPRNRR